MGIIVNLFTPLTETWKKVSANKVINKMEIETVQGQLRMEVETFLLIRLYVQVAENHQTIVMVAIARKNKRISLEVFLQKCLLKEEQDLYVMNSKKQVSVRKAIGANIVTIQKMVNKFVLSS